MDKKTLYLECYSGISGDMTVAALLDLGAREEFLRSCLEALPVKEYKIAIGRTKKCGVGACDFHVILENENPHAHHHMHHAHNHVHHDHEHVHENEHHHEHTHAHEHRTFGMIRNMLRESAMPEKVKELSEKIFLVVAEAEAKVHESTVEEVHFHEVGAVDSIVDIVGAAACIVDLGIEEVIISPLHEGTGTVWCQHGRVPVPAPAVLEIVSSHKMPLVITQTQGEMVTPTGAAIAAALRTEEHLPESFVVEKIGIGAGKKEFKHANILRAMLITACENNKKKDAIEAEDKENKDTVWVLETNVDDCSGEQLGYVIENLMAAGARDASCFPIYMKKHRPAYMLQVICKKEDIDKLETIIFRETTSIGLRKYEEQRRILSRSLEQIDTTFGTAQVKVCQHKDMIFPYPEYASIEAICKQTGKNYQEVYDLIIDNWKESHGK